MSMSWEPITGDGNNGERGDSGEASAQSPRNQDRSHSQPARNGKSASFLSQPPQLRGLVAQQAVRPDASSASAAPKDHACSPSWEWDIGRAQCAPLRSVTHRSQQSKMQHPQHLIEVPIQLPQCLPQSPLRARSPPSQRQRWRQHEERAATTVDEQATEHRLKEQTTNQVRKVQPHEPRRKRQPSQGLHQGLLRSQSCPHPSRAPRDADELSSKARPGTTIAVDCPTRNPTVDNHERIDCGHVAEECSTGRYNGGSECDSIEHRGERACGRGAGRGTGGASEASGARALTHKNRKRGRGEEAEACAGRSRGNEEGRRKGPKASRWRTLHEGTDSRSRSHDIAPRASQWGVACERTDQHPRSRSQASAAVSEPAVSVCFDASPLKNATPGAADVSTPSGRSDAFEPRTALQASPYIAAEVFQVQALRHLRDAEAAARELSKSGAPSATTVAALGAAQIESGSVESEIWSPERAGLPSAVISSARGRSSVRRASLLLVPTSSSAREAIPGAGAAGESTVSPEPQKAKTKKKRSRSKRRKKAQNMDAEEKGTEAVTAVAEQTEQAEQVAQAASLSTEPKDARQNQVAQRSACAKSGLSTVAGVSGGQPRERLPAPDTLTRAEELLGAANKASARAEELKQAAAGYEREAEELYRLAAEEQKRAEAEASEAAARADPTAAEMTSGRKWGKETIWGSYEVSDSDPEDEKLGDDNVSRVFDTEATDDASHPEPAMGHVANVGRSLGTGTGELSGTSAREVQPPSNLTVPQPVSTGVPCLPMSTDPSPPLDERVASASSPMDVDTIEAPPSTAAGITAGDSLGFERSQEERHAIVNFGTPEILPRGRYDVSSSDESGHDESGYEDQDEVGGFHAPIALRTRETVIPMAPVRSSPGRYDVSSSENEGDATEDDVNSDIISSAGSSAGADQGGESPEISPTNCAPGRYDVSSSSASGLGTPLSSPPSASYGRYDISSSSDGSTRWTLDSDDNSVASSTRIDGKRRRLSQAPGARYAVSSSSSSSAASSTASSDRSFDVEEYNRFFAPKQAGGGGGLGLPHPSMAKNMDGRGRVADPGGSSRPTLNLNPASDESQHTISAAGFGQEARALAEGKRAGDKQPQPPLSSPAGALVVPSGADFEWGYVDIEDPLKQHGSLMDRLAGRGTPLPGMPVPIERSTPIPISPPSPAADKTTMAVDGQEIQQSRSTSLKTSTVNVQAGRRENAMRQGTTSTANHPAVTSVSRDSGNQHWGTVMNADSMPRIDLNTSQQRHTPDTDRLEQSSGGMWSSTSKPAPPMPMRDDPEGSGQQVIDAVAHERMFPGGATVTMKGFNLRGKSAVSAAFELCVSMEPKCRPKFEYKDSVPTKSAAKSVKLAKQLAALNFLREAVGTRMELDLTQLAKDAGGSATANAALAAAVSRESRRGSSNNEIASNGKGKGKALEAGARSQCSSGTGGEDITRLALDSGVPNYVQTLHDLVAAHPDTPAHASYAFVSTKQGESKGTRGDAEASQSKSKGFKCIAKLLKHTVDVEKSELRKKEESKAKELELSALAALEASPKDQALKEAFEKARQHALAVKAVPMLNIEVLEAEGTGQSKRDAKHRAAEAMAYKLIPGCQSDTELRRRAKAIMEKYQKEKKEWMEEEQTTAQREKALRLQAEAEAARHGTLEAKGRGETVEERPSVDTHGTSVRLAVDAAKSAGQDRARRDEASLASRAENSRASQGQAPESSPGERGKLAGDGLTLGDAGGVASSVASVNIEAASITGAGGNPMALSRASAASAVSDGPVAAAFGAPPPQSSTPAAAAVPEQQQAPPSPQDTFATPANMATHAGALAPPRSASGVTAAVASTPFASDDGSASGRAISPSTQDARATGDASGERVSRQNTRDRRLAEERESEGHRP